MSRFLSNGSRFAFKRSSSSVAYCAVHIKTGTRNEPEKLNGLAHFTEHLLFKGTHSKSSCVINSKIEKLGGELNAYTTKEETVIHATVLKEDLRTAISLLVELAFQCVFPAKEVEKERSVVIEEIKSYKDSPSELIYDEFEERVFGGTALSAPVLGTALSLRRITREDVEDYYHRMFVPENMVFTVVADLSCERVVSIIEKELVRYGGNMSVSGKSVDVDAGLLSEESADEQKTSFIGGGSFEREVGKKSHQAHCIIGARAYSFYSPKRIPLILLVNYLGGPAANSRLNLVLREKYALVYNVEASYAQYSDAGVVTLYFGCDKSNVKRCEELIMRQIYDIIEHPLSERRLKEAKKQLLGQIAISSDNGEAQVLSMGKSEMVFGEVIEMEKTRELLEKVTSQELSQVAAEIFAPRNISKLYYV